METARPNTIERTSLKIGDYEICPVPTGIFGLDGGAMFGTVPKVLWEKSNPPDEKNRIPMEARALLLKSPSKKILIDCGNGGDFIAKYGEKLGSKFSEMYGVQGEALQLKESLARYGVKPEDVTDVILTHLHFDHAGGGVCEKNGELVPTFKNATYYVQKRNLETAETPNIREKASYFPANFAPLLKHNVLKILDGNTSEVLPGISVEVSNGHTQGHQMVLIKDQSQALLYCGDVIPTSSHVRLAWVMGYDLDPLKIITEKTDVLKRAAQEKWHLFFEHDPYCDAATVVSQGSDFAVERRYHLSSD
jgi:glyoxylase-like metal-dependent hydrolase (beta-lactamase superfamily II)